MDPIDPLKTTAALTWLTSLLYVVPIKDARTFSAGSGSGAGSGSKEKDSKEMEDTEEDARTMTMRFEEWALVSADWSCLWFAHVAVFAAISGASAGCDQAPGQVLQDELDRFGLHSHHSTRTLVHSWSLARCWCSFHA